MATKKQSKPASNDMATFWKWLYVGGILVASVAGAAGLQNDILTMVLVAIGLLAGLFYFDPSDLMNFGIRYLVVTAAAASLGVFPAIGGYLTGFFTAFATFLGPVVLGMAVTFFWKKYFGS